MWEKLYDPSVRLYNILCRQSALYTTAVYSLNTYGFTCLYKGGSERAKREEGKCKYLVHLCIAASVIKPERVIIITQDHVPLGSLLCDGRRRAGGVKWDAGPCKQGRKKCKATSKALVISCCKWSTRQEVVDVVALFQSAHTWLRPAGFPYVLSLPLLTARLALSQPTTNFRWPATASTEKGNVARFLDSATAVSKTRLSTSRWWFLFHFQWFRRTPLAILETWHKEGDWAESSSRKHEGNFFFSFFFWRSSKFVLSELLAWFSTCGSTIVHAVLFSGSESSISQ